MAAATVPQVRLRFLDANLGNSESFSLRPSRPFLAIFAVKAFLCDLCGSSPRPLRFKIFVRDLAPCSNFAAATASALFRTRATSNL